MLLKATDRGGRSVLAMAARGGSGNVFLQALNFLREEFADDQVLHAIDTCATDPAKFTVVVSSEVNRFIVRGAYRRTNSV